MAPRRRLGFVLAACAAAAACGNTPTGSGSAPGWQQPGGPKPVNDALVDRDCGAIATDPAGNPVVAVSEQGASALELRVRRWDGATWQPLGGALNVDPTYDAMLSQTLAVDGTGRVVVAWDEGMSSTFGVHVKRWDGSSWIALGGALNANGSIAGAAGLALDPSGNPVVAWNEGLGGNAGGHVARWTGSDWSPYPAVATVGTLAIDAAGNPVVVTATGSTATVQQPEIIRWDGSAWVSVGGILNVDAAHHASVGSLALDPGGRPVVALIQETDGWYGHQAYVRAWDGAAWSTMGEMLNADPAKPAYNPVLAVAADGSPVVAYYEDIGTPPTATNLDVRVKRWNGTTWEALGTSLDVDPAHQSRVRGLALSSGSPVVLWIEQTETTNEAYVKRYSD